MLTLPNEIIHNLSNHLSYPSLANLSGTCKELYNVLTDLKQHRREHIAWKITVHVLLQNNRMILDRAWVTLGYNPTNFYQEYFNEGFNEYCSYCEVAMEESYSCNGETVYIHGNHTVKHCEIVTIINRGVGGELVDKMIKTCYIDNDEKCIPLTIIPSGNMLSGMDYEIIVEDFDKLKDYNINWSKADMIDAKLIIRDLNHHPHQVSGIEKYSLHGLYLRSPRDLNAPYTDLAYLDLFGYPDFHYNDIDINEMEIE